MGNISFVWLGEVIPPQFIENYKTCCKVNPHYTSRIFRDEQIEHLAQVYGIYNIYQELNLVNRCNLAKYLVLHYFPLCHCICFVSNSNWIIEFFIIEPTHV